MLAAQKDPEKYRNLIVRIAGYSAYFMDLSPVQQAEIIVRTEQQMVKALVVHHRNNALFERALG
jgi:formate C-acetyltransferase